MNKETNMPEATKPWLVTPEDGIKMLNWFRDELNKTRKERDVLKRQVAKLNSHLMPRHHRRTK